MKYIWPLTVVCAKISSSESCVVYAFLKYVKYVVFSKTLIVCLFPCGMVTFVLYHLIS